MNLATIFQSVAHCNTDLWPNEVEDGIFWFCNSESILAQLEEMTKRAEDTLERSTCRQENLFTSHSLQQVSIKCIPIFSIWNTKAFCKTKLHSRGIMQVTNVYLRLQNRYYHYCFFNVLLISTYLRILLHLIS